jgi:hypothetical protein
MRPWRVLQQRARDDLPFSVDLMVERRFMTDSIDTTNAFTAGVRHDARR